MSGTDDFRLCDTDALNALLRDEAAAVEAYTRALGHFSDPFVVADLQKIRDDHSRAVRELRDHVVQFGGEPATDAGCWGAAAPTAAAAKAIGPAAVLAALRQGEECAAIEYEGALGNDDLHPDCRRTIRAALLTACSRHAEELDRLLGGMDS
jgi:hypothetical protein